MNITNLRQTYQIKVTLKNSKPPIWRRIHVPSNILLIKLHDVIQMAMGWKDCHLHEFHTKDHRYGEPDILDESWGIESEKKDESKHTLSDLLKKEKDKMIYTYDFGDYWEHQVILEKILPFNPDSPKINCITGKRACPPENCGGIPGYFHLVNALNDSDNPEYAGLYKWVDDDFDPESVDINAINGLLHKYTA